MTSPNQIKVLLFDLGGVVIDIDFERMFEAWARHSPLSATEIRARFALDKAYEQHERGTMSASAYFDHLRHLLELDASDEVIAQGWNALFVDAINESVEMIRAVDPGLPRFAFSNTNPTHMAAWSQGFPEVVAAFDGIFVSSELGMRKPEQRAFATVASKIGVKPSAILFFDDLLQNVRSAQALGMQAVHVRRPDDIRQGLAAIGAL